MLLFLAAIIIKTGDYLFMVIPALNGIIFLFGVQQDRINYNQGRRKRDQR